MIKKILWTNSNYESPKKHHSSDIQSIYFFSDEWDLDEAKDWVESHNFPIMKITEEGRQYRFRIRDPSSFKRFITKIVGDDIHLVIGFYDGTEMSAKAYLK